MHTTAGGAINRRRIRPLDGHTLVPRQGQHFGDSVIRAWTDPNSTHPPVTERLNDRVDAVNDHSKMADG
jgi:hypothetical protein